jgi:2,3-diketo-5-methylthiopentyl-1-phosphate enolase
VAEQDEYVVATYQVPSTVDAAQLADQIAVGMTDKVSLDWSTRLVDLDRPPSWITCLPGPRCGAVGLRARLGVPARRLLMSIVKADNGRLLSKLRDALRDQVEGGAGVVKDEEISRAYPNAPAGDRMRVVRERGHGCRVGRPPPLRLNLTASGPALVDQARRLMEADAEALLVSLRTVGLDGLRALTALESAPRCWRIRLLPAPSPAPWIEGRPP